MKNSFGKSFFFLALASTFLLGSCDDDSVPAAENEEEVITDVLLTFTPAGGGNAVTALSSDPDGEGPGERVTEDIVLAPNTTYILTIELENKIAGESITEEVRAEADEHLFLFSWTDAIFSNPTGDGNIDNRTDPVNYLDTDSQGLDLGLETSWTIADPATGNFRLVLKHQPDSKTVSSGINTGETDVDISWDIIVTE